MSQVTPATESCHIHNWVIDEVTSHKQGHHTHTWVMGATRHTHELSHITPTNKACAPSNKSHKEECVAVCCRVLQYATVCCSALQCVSYSTIKSHQWECVAVCCRVLQCVAVCCSVLPCVAVCVIFHYQVTSMRLCCSVSLCVAVCCSVLQCVSYSRATIKSHQWECVAVCCSLLQCVAVCVLFHHQVTSHERAHSLMSSHCTPSRHTQKQNKKKGHWCRCCSTPSHARASSCSKKKQRPRSCCKSWTPLRYPRT